MTQKRGLSKPLRRLARAREGNQQFFANCVSAVTVKTVSKPHMAMLANSIPPKTAHFRAARENRIGGSPPARHIRLPRLSPIAARQCRIAGEFRDSYGRYDCRQSPDEPGEQKEA
jgi:hypothetical protein